MRLWSLHPQYLDSKGLVALWREGLLAKKVLEGTTKGYRNHPQLERFRLQAAPVKAVCDYLHEVLAEARRRSYTFDESKLPERAHVPAIPVTDGQMAHEAAHLLAKLRVRDPERCRELEKQMHLDPHPSFTVVPGPVEQWERAYDAGRELPVGEEPGN